jgi:hypothetical protein
MVESGELQELGARKSGGFTIDGLQEGASPMIYHLKSQLK